MHRGFVDEVTEDQIKYSQTKLCISQMKKVSSLRQV